MARPQKNVRRKAVGLTEDADSALHEYAARLGVNETEAINRLLTGADRFGPVAEGWIRKEMNETGVSRAEVIERALLDASKLSRQ